MPKCLKSSVKYPQSVMVWGAMSAAGVGPLCFIKGRVNAASYQRILEHFMLPSVIVSQGITGNGSCRLRGTLEGYIGGLFTALQNAVDKPLMLVVAVYSGKMSFSPLQPTEHYFKGDGKTLSERFAGYQTVADEHASRPKSPEIHRRIDLSTNIQRKHACVPNEDKVFVVKEEPSKRKRKKKKKHYILTFRVCPPALCFPLHCQRRSAGKQSGDVTALLSGWPALTASAEKQSAGGQTAEGNEDIAGSASHTPIQRCQREIQRRNKVLDFPQRPTISQQGPDRWSLSHITISLTISLLRHKKQRYRCVTIEKKVKNSSTDLRGDKDRRRIERRKERGDSKGSRESSDSRKKEKAHKEPKEMKVFKDENKRKKDHEPSPSLSDDDKDNKKESRDEEFKGPMEPKEYPGFPGISRPRGTFQFRIRGRGRARGVFAGTSTSPVNTAPSFQKRSKEEEWDPEYTPKSKKYFLHDDRDDGVDYWARRARGRGNFQRGRGRFPFKKSGSSPKWTHDKYQGDGLLDEEDETVEDERKDEKVENRFIITTLWYQFLIQ
ncbi:unnamed protein product [Ranitomeya imitator]|uniref:Btz domain-containing protein n=1 Tax=Ranitomeya imitator TaxID=111125 RepID=A0ABN9KMN0_9NEOB|nr:unnamed protein product [Ranitomeya imitator]